MRSNTVLTWLKKEPVGFAWIEFLLLNFLLCLVSSVGTSALMRLLVPENPIPPNDGEVVQIFSDLSTGMILLLLLIGVVREELLFRVVPIIATTINHLSPQAIFDLTIFFTLALVGGFVVIGIDEALQEGVLFLGLVLLTVIVSLIHKKRSWLIVSIVICVSAVYFGFMHNDSLLYATPYVPKALLWSVAFIKGGGLRGKRLKPIVGVISLHMAWNLMALFKYGIF